MRNGSTYLFPICVGYCVSQMSRDLVDVVSRDEISDDGAEPPFLVGRADVRHPRFTACVIDVLILTGVERMARMSREVFGKRQDLGEGVGVNCIVRSVRGPACGWTTSVGDLLPFV